MTSSRGSVTHQLRKEGHRLTKIRQALVDIFTAHHLPLTAYEIQGLLLEQGLSSNKTTIYRELEFLLGKDVISQVQFQDRVARYELKTDHHHHHLICTSCSVVQDVAFDDNLEKHAALISAATDFTITSHSLEFYGHCARCK
ncbi:MAG: Fur family transcriptional regulator [Patescibacteria group bacterium]